MLLVKRKKPISSKAWQIKELAKNKPDWIDAVIPMGATINNREDMFGVFSKEAEIASLCDCDQWIIEEDFGDACYYQLIDNDDFLELFDHA